MTFQETNKNSRDLFCRNNLSSSEAKERLMKYFSEQETEDILNSASWVTSWTDGHIAVINTTSVGYPKYTIVASGLYMELIEP